MMIQIFLKQIMENKIVEKENEIYEYISFHNINEFHFFKTINK